MRNLPMLQQRNRILPAMALCLGIGGASATIAQVANEQPSTGGYQPPMHGVIRAGDTWIYSGDIIVTDIQGRFCEGFKCAHGRGALGGELAWSYAGTFRYGDIVGEGRVSIEDDEGNLGQIYSGPILSTPLPGGPVSLCGEPTGGRASLATWPNYLIQAGTDKAPCLAAWVRRVDRGEVLPQEEAQRSAQWYKKVRTAQLTVLGEQSSRTFDKVTLAGTDMREFLARRTWRPRPGASIYVWQYRRGAAQSDTFDLMPDNFAEFTGPDFPVSEFLPMQLGTGSSSAVNDDPWVAVGLVISIDPTGYVVSFREPGQ
jgi:hypothetical protein